MKRFIFGLWLLAEVANAQSTGNLFGRIGTGSFVTLPSGTVTGANQYRCAGGLAFCGDNFVVDNGAGNISLTTLTASGEVSASVFTVNRADANAQMSWGRSGTYWYVSSPSNDWQLGGPTSNNFFYFDNRASGGPALGIGYGSGIAPSASANLDVSGTISATNIITAANIGACLTSANIGQIVRNPAKNTYGVCIGALSVAPLVTATSISPSAL